MRNEKRKTRKEKGERRKVKKKLNGETAVDDRLLSLDRPASGPDRRQPDIFSESDPRLPSPSVSYSYSYSYSYSPTPVAIAIPNFYPS